MAKWHTRNGIHAPTWARVRRMALDRAGWRCQARGCGRAGRLEVHHKTPLARGGARYALHNLAVLCRRCHLEETAEGNRRKPTPEESRWRHLVEDLAHA